MESTTVRLSTEELIFAFLVEGRPALTADIVAAMQRAGLSKTAALAYSRAAQHSLMARGLFDVDAAAFAEPLRSVARAMVSATFSIAYRRADTSVLYYFGELGTFEQRVEQGVIHELRATDAGNESVLQAGAALFEIDPEQPGADVTFDMSADVFQDVKNARDRAYVERRLAEAGVPDSARQALAEDLHTPVYRGEVLHATHDENGIPRPDGGLLVLGGASHRAWLLHGRDRVRAKVVTVTLGTEAAFQRLAGALLR